VVKASWPHVTAAEVGRLLSLRLSQQDAERMRDLGEQAQSGTLNDVERAELAELVAVSEAITLLKSLARQAGPSPAAGDEVGPPSPRRRRQAS